MRSNPPLSPSIFMDWRGTRPVNPSARILWWLRIWCAFCPRRSRRCGSRNLRRVAFTPSEAHVGTAALVSSSTTWFTFCSDTSFTVLGSNSIRQPTLHGRGALAGEIEFADHGAAVIHQHPLPDSD